MTRMTGGVHLYIGLVGKLIREHLTVLKHEYIAGCAHMDSDIFCLNDWRNVHDLFLS